MTINNKYNYVIFHRKCLDGFTGFIILHNTKTILKDALIYPDVPSATIPPPNIYNKDIIIIDVAYKYNVLRDIVLKAKSVTFIDHHITIHDDVKRIAKEFSHKKLFIIYDEHKSGATLVWDYFYPHKPRPLFIQFIEDNDIGTWKIPNVYDFITALQVKYPINLKPETIKMWSKLFKVSTIKKLIKLGSTYMEYKKFISEEHSKRYSVERFPSDKIYSENKHLFKSPGQYKVAVYCGSPCPASSDISKLILKNNDYDFFMSWVLNLDRKEFVFTFRSLKVDVGEIAKIFNGGGHKLASAGSIKMNGFDIRDLFVGESLPRN
jgi:oligoribonuclease NrnB/cAMP/cGMP phosphodiesterase (DHH superfamily)